MWACEALDDEQPASIITLQRTRVASQRTTRGWGVSRAKFFPYVFSLSPTRRREGGDEGLPYKQLEPMAGLEPAT